MLYWRIKPCKILVALTGVVLGLGEYPAYGQIPVSPISQADLQFLRVTTDSTSVDIGGSCEGGVYVPREMFKLGEKRRNSSTGHFLSHQTPPAPGLRVTIRNVTPGMNPEAIPTIDLAYSGVRSQQLVVRQGKTHTPPFLVVVPGKNTFTYVIQQGDQVVETGTFSAHIDAESSAVPIATDGVAQERALRQAQCAEQQERQEQQQQAQQERLRQQQQALDRELNQQMEQQQRALQNQWQRQIEQQQRNLQDQLQQTVQQQQQIFQDQMRQPIAPFVPNIPPLPMPSNIPLPPIP